MEKLPKDIISKLALELSPPDLISFCLTSKGHNLCSKENKIFWRQKIQKDYPIVWQYYQRMNINLPNPKNTYIRKFTEISTRIEKYISDKYPKLDNVEKEELLVALYNIYKEVLENPHLLTMSFRKYTENLVPMIEKQNLKKYGYVDYDVISELMMSLFRLDDMYVIR